MYNSAANPCYKPDRDMPFLCMLLYREYHTISDALKRRIGAMLGATIRTGNKGNVSCDLGALCPEHKLAKLTNRYEFLDRADVQVPSGTSERVERLFRDYKPPKNTRKQTQTSIQKFMSTIFGGKTRRNHARPKFPTNREVRVIRPGS